MEATGSRAPLPSCPMWTKNAEDEEHRRCCDTRLPNTVLELMASSCSKELNLYLQITYHCQEGRNAIFLVIY